MKRLLCAIALGGLAAALAWIGPAPAETAGEPAPKETSDAPTPQQEGVFEMEEVSVFELLGSPAMRNLTGGQSAECGTEPHDEVKAYPKPKSKRPLYGKVAFDRKDFYSLDAGIQFHFFIDESQGTPTPAKEGPDDAQAEPTSSLLENLTAALTGGEKEEKAEPDRPAATYDRFYFDLNRDLDLTNDPVLMPRKRRPPISIPNSAQQYVFFDDLAIPFDHGPELGSRSLCLVPRLIISERDGKEYPYVYFVATTARKGSIRIGPREYEAILGQPYLITGRFDRPYTRLYLEPRKESWLGGDQLRAMREVEGILYALSATPTGDQLIVKPYQGDFGVLEIGRGDREVEECSISGSLESATAAVRVGTAGDDTWSLGQVQKARVPVGDYLPYFVSIEYGRLRISVSNNYHSDGASRDRQGRPTVYGIKIRKDQPYVWDFSNEPEVMFVSPAKDQSFNPGDEIEVKAVLTDPELDIMIRRLEDTTRTQEQTFERSDGSAMTIKGNLSLDPIVTITDSSGNQVAQGKMPFG